jgi:hypothetical protein
MKLWLFWEGGREIMEVTLPIDVLGEKVVGFFTKNVENFSR